MPKIKILHIIDNTTFYEYLRATFEFNGIENTYAKYHEINLESLSNDYDLVFFHYLKAEHWTIIRNQHFPINKIVWYVWGADLFCLGAFFNSNLLPETLKNRESYWKSKGLIYYFKMKFHASFPRLFDWHPMYLPIRKSVNAIKNVVTLIPKDAELLLENYNSTINHWHINYVDPIFLNEQPIPFNSGNNILLGNSSEFTNNHIDFLKTVDLTKELSYKLLIPLSYGNAYNATLVEQYIRENLDKDKVQVIKDFIPFDEYTRLLSTCEIAILPHLRQQALGNVIKLLYGGCHLYFYEDSGVYQFLEKNNFLVSKIGTSFMPKKLTEPEKLINRQLTTRYFGKSVIRKKVLEMITSLI